MNRFGQLCYTYLIGWSKHDVWYYGSRGANKLEPMKDIMKKYFTSSQLVENFIIKEGPPDIIKIHKLFDSYIDAKRHEGRFLRRVNAANNIRFLNKSNNTWPSESYKRTPQHRQLLSERAKLAALIRKERGLPGPNKGKKLNGNYVFPKPWITNSWRIGKKWSNEIKEKISASNKGKNTGKSRPHTPESKAKMSESKKKFWEDESNRNIARDNAIRNNQHQYFHSDESRKKQAETMKQYRIDNPDYLSKTPEQRKNCSKARLKFLEENGPQLHTEETKNKMSSSAKKSWTPERRAAQAEILRARHKTNREKKLHSNF